jgi:8-hydroxy-5-deazaflavin:NADPH oxidoreductase
VRIGILGGTGPAGQGLAARLASVGLEVVMGSRSSERARGICDELCDRWPDRRLVVQPGDNFEAASADIIVVATPWDAAASTVAALAERFVGKVVISMANAVTKLGNEFVPLIPPRGSIAAGVQQAAPGALVAAAFHHLPAKELANLDRELEADVLVCSDHQVATTTTIQLIGKVPGLRGVDAGALSAATPIEALTPVLLQINHRYRTRASIRLTNINLA